MKLWNYKSGSHQKQRWDKEQIKIGAAKTVSKQGKHRTRSTMSKWQADETPTKSQRSWTKMWKQQN